MTTLTLEAPAELVLTCDPVPPVAPPAWLSAAVEALQTFRRLD